MLGRGAASTWLVDGVEPTDPETRDRTRPFVELCRRIAAQAAEWHSERFVLDPEITIEVERPSGRVVLDHGGTPDFCAVSLCGTTAWVVDYKSGYVPVLAERNEQLLSYALCKLRDWPTVETWRLSIVQPNTPGPAEETWEATTADVRAYESRVLALRDEARHSEYEAGDHCRYCPAVATCQHLYDLAGQAAQLEFHADLKTDNGTDPDEEAARCLRVLSIETAFKAAIEEAKKRLTELGRLGKDFPGTKWVNPIVKRRWFSSDPEEVLKKLKSRGVDKREATEAVLKKFTELEKELPKGTLDNLVIKPEPGEPVLVPEHDRLRAVERPTPENDFAEDLA